MEPDFFFFFLVLLTAMFKLVEWWKLHNY